MVQIEANPRDPAAAWRVRDALAAHPLLGGATAQIEICANRETIILEGWVLDETVRALAVRLAQRAAGRRTVQNRLNQGVRPCNPTPLT
jgi:osmotically-inducible protein OsmY